MDFISIDRTDDGWVLNVFQGNNIIDTILNTGGRPFVSHQQAVWYVQTYFPEIYIN